MSGRLTCPQGHQWEPAVGHGDPAARPVCGAKSQSMKLAASALLGPEATPSFPSWAGSGDPQPLAPTGAATNRPGPPPTEPISPTSAATVAPDMASFHAGLNRVNVPGFE